MDLFCETDHETVSQSRRSCRLERDRSSFGWDYCKAANECHFMSNNMRTAIVTGGGSGIGQDVGLALCAARWTVVIAGRKVGTLERTRQLAQGSGLIETHVTDVTDDASVEQLFDAVVERYGHLDLLFNNAGINVPLVALDQLSTTELRSIIATNLLGSFLCARAAFRVMKAQTPQGGRIINNGSVSAYAPRPNSAPYSATKHGITGLTKSLVLDGRAFNIACGQIDIAAPSPWAWLEPERCTTLFTGTADCPAGRMPSFVYRVPAAWSTPCSPLESFPVRTVPVSPAPRLAHFRLRTRSRDH